MFRQMRFETNGLQGKYVWGLPACRNCKLIESLLLFSWVAVWNDISSDKPSMEPHFTAIHVQRLGYYFNCGWAGAKSFLPPIWDGWNPMGCLKNQLVIWINRIRSLKTPRLSKSAATNLLSGIGASIRWNLVFFHWIKFGQMAIVNYI